MPTPIYRITHYTNLPFILRHGIFARNSANTDPNYVNIGHLTLVESRGHRIVPIPPGGPLNNYVPFYFTNRSPMLYLIHKGNVPDFTGTQGELVYLVSTVEAIADRRIPFVFTDRHAKLEYAEFRNSINELDIVDWDVIHSDTWNNTPQFNDRKEKKQAEFLVHQHVPLECILGIGVYDNTMHQTVGGMVADSGKNIPVGIRQTWYY